jgi:hypothetical protein
MAPADFGMSFKTLSLAEADAAALSSLSRIVMAAVRTLKSDDAGIDMRHLSFVCFVDPLDRAGTAGPPVPNSIFCQDGVFICAAHQGSERAKGGVSFQAVRPNRSCGEGGIV